MYVSESNCFILDFGKGFRLQTLQPQLHLLKAIKLKSRNIDDQNTQYVFA